MPSFDRVAGLVLVLTLVGACSAPPTPEQATSRAIKRNCEAQAEVTAGEVKRDSAALGLANAEIESRAAEARERAFASCMREYAL